MSLRSSNLGAGLSNHCQNEYESGTQIIMVSSMPMYICVGWIDSIVIVPMYLSVGWIDLIVIVRTLDKLQQLYGVACDDGVTCDWI